MVGYLKRMDFPQVYPSSPAGVSENEGNELIWVCFERHESVGNGALPLGFIKCLGRVSRNRDSG